MGLCFFLDPIQKKDDLDVVLGSDEILVCGKFPDPKIFFKQEEVDFILFAKEKGVKAIVSNEGWSLPEKYTVFGYFGESIIEIVKNTNQLLLSLATNEDNWFASIRVWEDGNS